MISLLVLGLAALFQAQLPTPDVIEKRLLEIVDANRRTASIWAVSFRSESGAQVLSLNEEIAVTPASNLKLVSSAVILEYLGENHRFVTRGYISGEIRNGVLMGNVTVSGAGDPSINKKTWGDPLRVLESFADSLKALGITSVDGDILADNSLFDGDPYPEGWEWKDLTFYYGVEIDALSFNNNAIDLEVRANGPVGSAPSISWYPFNTNYVKVQNKQVITEKGTRYRESYHRLPGSNVITLKSRLPQGYLETESLSVPEPSAFFVHTLRTVLSKKGIKVHAKKYPSLEGKRQVWSHTSPPVSEMMEEILGRSNNFYTEMLLRTAAAKATREPATAASAVQVLRSWVASQGMDSASVMVQDGSGLSAAALVNAGLISEVLHKVRSKPWFEVFERSLATPGKPGTLQSRYTQTAFASGLRAKTGYISGVRSLSGYLICKSGQKVSFSLITNHFTVKTAVIDKVHEQFLQLAYENL